MKTLVIILPLLLLYPVRSYSQISGCITVGTLGGENYSSLTNAGGLFNAINTLGVSGNMIVKITSNLNENGTNSLNSWAGGFFMTIVPASPSLKTITYTGGCGSGMLRFMGTDNLTIDGRENSTGCFNTPLNGNYLRFVSNCNQYPVMLFDGDCQNVLLTNINVASDNSSNSTSNGGAINVRPNQIAGSDNFSLYGSLIEDFSGTPDLFFGLQVNAPGAVAGVLTGLMIRRNNFHNVNCKGIMLTSNTGNINSSVINNNHFYATSTIPGPGIGWEYTAVEVESGSGHIVRANWVGGQASSCGGAKLNISLTGSSEFVVPFRFTSSVPNSSVNLIDSNIIRNISMTGSSSADIIATIIRIEGGNCNIGSVYGNTIGDLSVDASVAAGASIVYIEGVNSSNQSFRGIYTTSSGITNIENNCIGGILLEQTTALGSSTTLLYSLTSLANFRNNIIGSVSNSIVKKSTGNFRGIYADNTNAAFDIIGNKISGIATTTSFDGTFYCIRATAGTGAPTITQNTITALNIGPMALQPRVEAIDIDNPTAITTSNSISNSTINSSYAGTQFYGIDINNSTSSYLINYNFITDITLLNNAAIQTNVIPINIDGVASTFSVYANYIQDITINSASNSSYVRGIAISSATQNRLQNNVVLLSNSNQTNDIFLYGIYDDASSGTNLIWHNTIDIRGTASGTTRRSACYYRTGSCTRNIQNNIFNNRRTGGSGGHYAEYHNTTGGSTVSNYNLLYVEDNTNRLARYTSDRTFAAWQGLGFDLNGVTGLAPQNLVDPLTGMQTTILGNDIGNTTLGVGIDCILTARPLGAGYDMGAYELVTSTLGSPLPIQLTSFNAECCGQNVNLKWSTASEHDNDYFLLELSEDASKWTVLAVVNSKENSILLQNYNYLHIKPNSNAQYYYRIKQIDYDGSFTTSSIVHSSCYPDKETNCILASPNPSKGDVRLTSACRNMTITKLEITDGSGRLIKVYNDLNVCGNSSYNIDLNFIQSDGVYTIKALSEYQTSTVKIIILKN